MSPTAEQTEERQVSMGRCGRSLEKTAKVFRGRTASCISQDQQNCVVCNSHNHLTLLCAGPPYSWKVSTFTAEAQQQLRSSLWMRLHFYRVNTQNAIRRQRTGEEGGHQVELHEGCVDQSSARFKSWANSTSDPQKPRSSRSNQNGAFSATCQCDP